MLVSEFSTSLTGIQGLTLDNGSTASVTDTNAANDVLYVLHTGSGNISKTGIPSNVTNNPQGLTFDDSTGTSTLYILVDGQGQNPDLIVRTDPATGAVFGSFAAPRGNASGITLLGGSLYVTVEGDNQFGPGSLDVVKLDPTSGAELARFGGDFGTGRPVGLGNDGTSLILSFEFGGPHVRFLNATNGSNVREQRLFDPLDDFNIEGFDGLVFDTSSEELFLAKNNQVHRFDGDGRLIQTFTLTASGFNAV